MVVAVVLIVILIVAVASSNSSLFVQLLEHTHIESNLHLSLAVTKQNLLGFE